MKLVRMTLLAGALMALPAVAHGTVLGFEDLTTSGDPLPAGYGGLEWDNLFGVNPRAEGFTGGWTNGVTGANLVYNGSELPGTISRTTGFTLNAASFVGAWNDGLTITAQGFVGTDLAFAKSFVVNTTGAVPVVFDWAGVTSVTFSSAGGRDRFYSLSGTNFGLDNLRIDEAVTVVPEPASWLMMIAGFGVTGGLLRRRRSSRRVGVA